MIRAYLAVELRRARRSRAYLMTMLVPVFMYLAIGKLDASTAKDPDAQLYVLVSMAAYGAVSSALLVGLAVVQDRAGGWLRQLHLTPLRPRDVVLGRTLLGLAIGLPAILVVCVAGALAGGLHLSPMRWAEVVGTLWLGTIPFVLLGLAVGYVVSIQFGQAAGSLLQIVLALLGGLWIPAAVFPEPLRAISSYVPTNAMAALGRNAAFARTDDLGRSLIVLVGWSMVFFVAAALAYRASGRRLAS